MFKSDVLEHFGSVGAVALALGIYPAAVSQWGEIVPILRAYEIQEITEGKLKVDKTVYSLPKVKKDKAA